MDLEPVVCETEPAGLVRLSPTSSTPAEILSAQKKTADWLEDNTLPSAADIEASASAGLARAAFVSLVDPAATTDEQKENLLALKVPEEIQHLMGMLTLYDWEFVNEAKKIRNFVVSRLMEEASAAGRAGDRIKALGLLGKVTEVGLFTDKIEVKAPEASDEELDARIKERLNKLRGIQDALASPAEPIEDKTPRPATRADGVALVARLMSPPDDNQPDT